MNSDPKGWLVMLLILGVCYVAYHYAKPEDPRRRR